MVDREPLAGAAPSGHDFIGDHQHAMAIADFAQPREILRRRNKDAVGAHNRLKNNRRHVAFIADHVLDVIRACNIAAGIGVLDGAVVAVRLRRKHKADALASRLHRPAPRIAGCCNRAIVEP